MSFSRQHEKNPKSVCQLLSKSKHVKPKVFRGVCIKTICWVNKTLLNGFVRFVEVLQ